MPRVESLRDIRRAVLMEVVPMCGIASPQQRSQHARKIRQASRYCDQFFKVMAEEDCFVTEQHAIDCMAPAAVWIFGWAARQFAILVIKALWRRWHQE